MPAQQLPSEGWADGPHLPRSETPGLAHLVPGGDADSAGFPWAGRVFDHHGTEFADDDGSTPPGVAEAIAALRAAARAARAASERAGGASGLHPALTQVAERHADAVLACSRARFLVPLIAQAGDYGLTPEGRTVEKTQELSIVTVSAPDGRSVLPVFTSVATLQAWNPAARPIPVPGPQVALAAAQEKTDLIIVDPGNAETEFGIRRPALEAFALGQRVLPAWSDASVMDAFELSATAETVVRGVVLVPGDIEARLVAPELTVELQLDAGLDRDALDTVLGRLQQLWASDPVLTDRVDSLQLRVRAAQAGSANGTGRATG